MLKFSGSAAEAASQQENEGSSLPPASSAAYTPGSQIREEIRKGLTVMLNDLLGDELQATLLAIPVSQKVYSMLEGTYSLAWAHASAIAGNVEPEMLGIKGEFNAQTCEVLDKLEEVYTSLAKGRPDRNWDITDEADIYSRTLLRQNDEENDDA